MRVYRTRDLTMPSLLHETLISSAAMRMLLSSIDGVSVISGSERPLPHFDAYIPLLSLPRISLASKTKGSLSIVLGTVTPGGIQATN